MQQMFSDWMQGIALSGPVVRAIVEMPPKSDWSEFAPTMLATAAGGLITLASVWLTNRHQAKIAAENERAQWIARRSARQLADLEAVLDRLRDCYGKGEELITAFEEDDHSRSFRSVIAWFSVTFHETEHFLREVFPNRQEEYLNLLESFDALYNALPNRLGILSREERRIVRQAAQTFQSACLALQTALRSDGAKLVAERDYVVPEPNVEVQDSFRRAVAAFHEGATSHVGPQSAAKTYGGSPPIVL
jgi:hypothetical protein